MATSRRLALPLLCAWIGLVPARGAAADEGETVFQESCTGCHNAKTRPLDATRLTRQQWKEAVERMEGMGTEVPKGNKLTALIDWLERTHGADGAAPAKK